MKQLTGLVLIMLFLAGCKTSKPTSSADTVTITPSVLLDSITIVRSKDDLYQASVTKSIDMVHTHLKVDFDWTTQRMNGAAELTLKPHFYSASSVVLDAKNMDIKRVALMENGLQDLTYAYDSLQLNIALGKEIPGGQNFKLFIEYTAKPNEKKIGGSAAIQEDKGLYFINPLGKQQNKPQQIWTQIRTYKKSRLKLFNLSFFIGHLPIKQIRELRLILIYLNFIVESSVASLNLIRLVLKALGILTLDFLIIFKPFS